MISRHLGTAAYPSPNLSSNPYYKSNQIQKLKCVSWRLAVVFLQSIEAGSEDGDVMEQHRQVMLQLHLSDQQLNYILKYDLY